MRWRLPAVAALFLTLVFLAVPTRQVNAAPGDNVGLYQQINAPGQVLLLDGTSVAVVRKLNGTPGWVLRDPRYARPRVLLANGTIFNHSDRSFTDYINQHLMPFAKEPTVGRSAYEAVVGALQNAKQGTGGYLDVFSGSGAAIEEIALNHKDINTVTGIDVFQERALGQYRYRKNIVLIENDFVAGINSLPKKSQSLVTALWGPPTYDTMELQASDLERPFVRSSGSFEALLDAIHPKLAHGGIVVVGPVHLPAIEGALLARDAHWDVLGAARYVEPVPNQVILSPAEQGTLILRVVRGGAKAARRGIPLVPLFRK